MPHLRQPRSVPSDPVKSLRSCMSTVKHYEVFCLFLTLLALSSHPLIGPSKSKFFSKVAWKCVHKCAVWIMCWQTALTAFLDALSPIAHKIFDSFLSTRHTLTPTHWPAPLHLFVLNHTVWSPALMFVQKSCFCLCFFWSPCPLLLVNCASMEMKSWPESSSTPEPILLRRQVEVHSCSDSGTPSLIWADAPVTLFRAHMD